MVRRDRADQDRVAAVAAVGEREPSSVNLGRSPLSERAADRLAALTAQAAAVPTALVQLVRGDRLRLTGGVGLPSGWETLPDVPLASTLAGVVLSTGLPVVVDDVLRDPRVPEDAPVRRFGGRAFLGFPVRDQDDVPVGVCSAIDYRPRVWTADEMRAVDHAAETCTALFAKQLARQEADRQRRFLDAILDSLHVGVAACDETGRLTLFNAALRGLVGDPPAGGDMMAWVRDLTLQRPGGAALPAEEVPLLRALRGERVRDAELLVVAPDGRRRLLLVDGQAIVGPGGEPLGAVATLQDITARRRAERFGACELAVTTALAEAATMRQAGPRILAAVAGTLGWPHAELWLVDDRAEVLRPVAQWSAPEMPAAIGVPDQLSRGAGLVGAAWQRGGPVWIHDLGTAQSAISADDAERSRLRAALAIPVRSGEDTLGVLSVFADAVEDPEDGLVALLSGIAAHIGQFLERRRAEDLQRQLTRSKDDYLALVGHELRTPLTSVSAGVELLRDLNPDALSTQSPALLEIIERNTVALRHVIDDLLDLAALDSGHATLRLQRCDLADLVRGALADIEDTLSAAGLVLDVTLPEELLVDGDRVRLRQVVDHLLDNSMKYTPDGGKLSVTLTRDADTATLRVCDTGIGIPPEDRDRLFAHLYRSPYARDRRIPGSGLGLVVTRAILERHGGSIALDACDEPGTCIVVRLPLSLGHPDGLPPGGAGSA
jgi:signal transduction histidine kinase/PAS domain-containing protein